MVAPVGLKENEAGTRRSDSAPHDNLSLALCPNQRNAARVDSHLGSPYSSFTCDSQLSQTFHS